MELSKLEFAVNTEALEKAVTSLGTVQKAMADVNNEQKTKAAADKAAVAAAKLLAKQTAETAKGMEDLSKGTDTADKGLSKLEKMLTKVKDTTSFLREDVIKSETGFTTMQAGVMSLAKSLGASNDILNQFSVAFDNLNKVTGKNPFDSSIGGLRTMTNELRNLGEISKLTTAGFSITSTQVRLLSRDIEALTQKNQALGKTEAEINGIITEHKRVFLEAANSVNTLTAASIAAEKQSKAQAKAALDALNAGATMGNDAVALYKDNEVKKAQAFADRMKAEATMGNSAVDLYYKNEEKKRQATERRLKSEGQMNDQAVALFYKNQGKPVKGVAPDQAQKDQAKATKWLATETERTNSVLASLNSTQAGGAQLHEKAARSIAAFERNLRLSGMSADQATTALENYKKTQISIQGLEQKNQAKYLSRALQPQIGDVAVSLAAGQNPLTVMLQQGDQVRGLIAQSGLEGAALQKVMRDAFKSTLTSVKDTAVAMSSVVSGAFISLGKSIASPVTALLNLRTVSLKSTADLEAGLISATRQSRLMEVAVGRLAQTGMTYLGLAAGAAAAALGAMAIAAYQTSKQEDALSKSLVLTGGSLGLNKDAALGYAAALKTQGVSMSDSIDVMTAMANAGGFTAKEIQVVTIAAVNMQKYTGIAIDDTVKAFAKLKEKPVDALIDLAKASGLIEPAVLRAVNALVLQGDTAGASALAMKAGADVMKQQADEIKKEYSALGSVLVWFGKTWKDVWDAIKGTQYKTSVKEQLQTDLVAVQQRINEVRDNLSTLSKLGIKGDPALLNQLNATADEFSKQIQLIDAKSSAEEKAKAARSKAAEATKDEFRLAEDMHKRELSLLKETQTRQQFINTELSTQAKLRKAAGGVLSSGEVIQISKVAGQEFDKSKSKDRKKAERDIEREDAAILKELNDLRAEAAGYTSNYAEEVGRLNQGYVKYKMTMSEYLTLLAEIEKRQPYAKQAAKGATQAEKDKADALALVASLTDKADGNGKAYSATLAKLASYEGKFGITPAQIKEAKDALEAATPAAKAYAAVMADYGKTMSDIALQRQAVQDQYGTDFKTDKQKADLESLSKFTKSTLDADAEYEKSVKQIQGGEANKYYNDSKAKYLEVANAKKQAAQDLYDREKYLQSDTIVMYQAGFDALKGLAKDFSTVVTDQFMNFAIDGKSSFEELSGSFDKMVNRMINDLIRLQIQKQVAGLFDMAVGAAGDWLKGGSTPSVQDAGTPVGLQTNVFAANGAAFTNGIQMYAKGDVFSSPTAFRHSGGLGVLGEAGSEAVMPLKRDSSGSLGVVAQVSGGASATSVVINNYSSEKATATESVDSRGQRSINVTIGDVIAGEINRSGSASQKAMQGTFGVRQQLIRR